MRAASVLAVLTVIFIASIFTRINLINNTVNNLDHCDFFLLTAFENWNERGIADCHFTPILTYNNPGDKHVAYYKRLESAAGDNYFVSFPPFSFMFAYAALELIHQTPDKLSVQILNLFLHFISAFFIYLLILKFYTDHAFTLHLPSLIGYTAYLFIPILQYEHVVIYFPELLGQVLWIIALYFTMRWLSSNHSNKREAAIVLSIIIFLLTYTEWIGIFYVIILIVILRVEKES